MNTSSTKAFDVLIIGIVPRLRRLASSWIHRAAMSLLIAGLSTGAAAAVLLSEGSRYLEIDSADQAFPFRLIATSPVFDSHISSGSNDPGSTFRVEAAQNTLLSDELMAGSLNTQMRMATRDTLRSVESFLVQDFALTEAHTYTASAHLQGSGSLFLLENAVFSLEDLGSHTLVLLADLLSTDLPETTGLLSAGVYRLRAFVHQEGIFTADAVLASSLNFSLRFHDADGGGNPGTVPEPSPLLLLLTAAAVYGLRAALVRPSRAW